MQGIKDISSLKLFVEELLYQKQSDLGMRLDLDFNGELVEFSTFSDTKGFLPFVISVGEAIDKAFHKENQTWSAFFDGVEDEEAIFGIRLELSEKAKNLNETPVFYPSVLMISDALDRIIDPRRNFAHTKIDEQGKSIKVDLLSTVMDLDNVVKTNTHVILGIPTSTEFQKLMQKHQNKTLQEPKSQ